MSNIQGPIPTNRETISTQLPPAQQQKINKSWGGSIQKQFLLRMSNTGEKIASHTSSLMTSVLKLLTPPSIHSGENTVKSDMNQIGSQKITENNRPNITINRTDRNSIQYKFVKYVNNACKNSNIKFNFLNVSSNAFKVLSQILKPVSLGSRKMEILGNDLKATAIVAGRKVNENFIRHVVFNGREIIPSINIQNLKGLKNRENIKLAKNKIELLNNHSKYKNRLNKNVLGENYESAVKDQKGYHQGMCKAMCQDYLSRRLRGQSSAKIVGGYEKGANDDVAANFLVYRSAISRNTEESQLNDFYESMDTEIQNAGDRAKKHPSFKNLDQNSLLQFYKDLTNVAFRNYTSDPIAYLNGIKRDTLADKEIMNALGFQSFHKTTYDHLANLSNLSNGEYQIDFNTGTDSHAIVYTKTDDAHGIFDPNYGFIPILEGEDPSDVLMRLLNLYEPPTNTENKDNPNYQLTMSKYMTGSAPPPTTSADLSNSVRQAETNSRV